MNTTYWWFDVSSEGVGEPLLVSDLNQSILQETIEEFLINPENRNNLSKVPDYIEHIEKNTTNNQTGEEAWSEEKEEYFKKTLIKVFNETLNKELKSLVDKHIDANSKLKEMDLSSDGLELKDLLDKDSAHDFVGYPFKSGSSSASQKKLLEHKRIMTNGELFDDSVLSGITVKFTKDKPDIKITFTADHTTGDIQKNIFRNAFPKAKIFTEKDPVSIGGTIRQGFSGKVTDSYKSKKAGIIGSEDTYFTFEGKNYPITGSGIWAGAGPNPMKYLEMSRKPNVTGNKNKARVAWIRKVTIELGKRDNKYRKGHKEYNYKKLTAKMINLILDAEKRDTFGRGGQEKAQIRLDKEYTIKLDGVHQAKLLNKGVDSWKKGEENRQAFVKFFNELIESGTLYKYLKGVGIDLDPWRLQKYDFTFIINVEKGPNAEGEMLLDSVIKIEPSTRISSQGLSAQSQQYKFKRPIISGSTPGQKERAMVTYAQDSEGDKGFNEARDYFLKQLEANIQELQHAAPYLEVNE